MAWACGLAVFPVFALLMAGCREPHANIDSGLTGRDTSTFPCNPLDAQADSDGDGISDRIEVGDLDCMTPPFDTDHDGIPDFLDLDSDGDTILDAIEREHDRDRDGIANFRDLDSDGDRISDAIEAGDEDTSTPPHACPEELMPDGLADFIDTDSDNDGLSDGEEAELGTHPCDPDTDDDGSNDLLEAAYERVNCPDGVTGTGCRCATRADCQIPSQHFYVVLPYRGEAVQRDLQFGTSIRSADVFFLTDTTRSMGGTLDNVKATVAAPGTGLIARILETIPDAWVGGAQHDDFPFGSFGGELDQPLSLAIRMSPPERASDVAAAFNAITLHGGGDPPESQTEALYQAITGEGGSWMGSSGRAYRMPRHAADCLNGTWGAPCFREATLPIIVLFTDVCSHHGPPDEDRSTCNDYTDITPAPVRWADMIAAMNRRGAKFVGVNASNDVRCRATSVPGGTAPCLFLRRTAEETSSVDVDGNPLVYDLPNSASIHDFTETVVHAIETVATRVPFDVDTALRDEPSDRAGVDASRFIQRREPACNLGLDTCWEAANDIPHAQAVTAYDMSTFFGVVPGTRVTFRITFQNDFYPGGPTAEIFVAFIDVRGGGNSVLDTRQVFVIVPANDNFIPA